MDRKFLGMLLFATFVFLVVIIFSRERQKRHPTTTSNENTPSLNIVETFPEESKEHVPDFLNPTTKPTIVTAEPTTLISPQNQTTKPSHATSKPNRKNMKRSVEQPANNQVK